MSRNMKKAIDEYVQLSECNKDARRYAFYYSEIRDILDLSPSVIDGVMNGLMAGFAIGYKAGRKDQKEGRR